MNKSKESEAWTLAIQKIVDERLAEAKKSDPMQWEEITLLYGCNKLAKVNGSLIENRVVVAVFQNEKLAEKFASNCVMGDDKYGELSSPRSRSNFGVDPHLIGLLSGYDYYQIETVEINPTQEKLVPY